MAASRVRGPTSAVFGRPGDESQGDCDDGIFLGDDVEQGVAMLGHAAPRRSSAPRSLVSRLRSAPRAAWYRVARCLKIRRRIHLGRCSLVLAALIVAALTLNIVMIVRSGPHWPSRAIPEQPSGARTPPADASSSLISSQDRVIAGGMAESHPLLAHVLPAAPPAVPSARQQPGAKPTVQGLDTVPSYLAAHGILDPALGLTAAASAPSLAGVSALQGALAPADVSSSPPDGVASAAHVSLPVRPPAGATPALAAAGSDARLASALVLASGLGLLDTLAVTRAPPLWFVSPPTQPQLQAAAVAAVRSPVVMSAAAAAAAVFARASPLLFQCPLTPPSTAGVAAGADGAGALAGCSAAADGVPVLMSPLTIPQLPPGLLAAATRGLVATSSLALESQAASAVSDPAADGQPAAVPTASAETLLLPTTPSAPRSAPTSPAAAAAAAAPVPASTRRAPARTSIGAAAVPWPRMCPARLAGGGAPGAWHFPPLERIETAADAYRRSWGQPAGGNNNSSSSSSSSNSRTEPAAVEPWCLTVAGAVASVDSRGVVCAHARVGPNGCCDTVPAVPPVTTTGALLSPAWDGGRRALPLAASVSPLAGLLWRPAASTYGDTGAAGSAAGGALGRLRVASRARARVRGGVSTGTGAGASLGCGLGGACRSDLGCCREFEACVACCLEQAHDPVLTVTLAAAGSAGADAAAAAEAWLGGGGSGGGAANATAARTLLGRWWEPLAAPRSAAGAANASSPRDGEAAVLAQYLHRVSSAHGPFALDWGSPAAAAEAAAALRSAGAAAQRARTAEVFHQPASSVAGADGGSGVFGPAAALLANPAVQLPLQISTLPHSPFPAVTALHTATKPAPLQATSEMTVEAAAASVFDSCALRCRPGSRSLRAGNKPLHLNQHCYTPTPVLAAAARLTDESFAPSTPPHTQAPAPEAPSATTTTTATAEPEGPLLSPLSPLRLQSVAQLLPLRLPALSAAHLGASPQSAPALNASAAAALLGDVSAALAFVSPPPLSTALARAPRGRSCAAACSALGGAAQWRSLRDALLLLQRQQITPAVASHGNAAGHQAALLAGVRRAARQLLSSAPTSWQCHEPLLPVINTCEAMRRYFPCSRGCAVVSGHDKPSYVPPAPPASIAHSKATTVTETTGAPWATALGGDTWHVSAVTGPSSSRTSGSAVVTADAVTRLDGMCLLNANAQFWDCDSARLDTVRLCPCVPGDWPDWRAEALRLLAAESVKLGLEPLSQQQQQQQQQRRYKLQTLTNKDKN